MRIILRTDWSNLWHLVQSINFHRSLEHGLNLEGYGCVIQCSVKAHPTQGRMNTFSMKWFFHRTKVILYDIGLTENENAEMRKYCKCEVRKFPFHQFSAHVRLREAYAWKPLILFEVLKQYKFVMWEVYPGIVFCVIVTRLVKAWSIFYNLIIQYFSYIWFKIRIQFFGTRCFRRIIWCRLIFRQML
jgi:hypothetical protein